MYQDGKEKAFFWEQCLSENILKQKMRPQLINESGKNELYNKRKVHARKL